MLYIYICIYNLMIYVWILASIGWNFHQPTFGKPTYGGDFMGYSGIYNQQ